MCFICDVNTTSHYFQQDSSPALRARGTIELLRRTTSVFRFCSARHVANELTRPKSGGLCHFVCHSATCVWDQSSWHRWAATASTACVVQLGAVADWWCSWTMPNNFCMLVFVPKAVILNILCDYHFVFPVLEDASHHTWCSKWFSKSMKCDVSFSQRNG